MAGKKKKELTLHDPLLQLEHACRSLLTFKLAPCSHLRVLLLVCNRDRVLQDLHYTLDILVLHVECLTLVDAEGGVTTVIHELVASVRIWNG